MDFYMKSPDLLLLAEKFKNTLQAKQNTRVARLGLPLVSSCQFTALRISLRGTSQPHEIYTALFSGAVVLHPPGRADTLLGVGGWEQDEGGKERQGSRTPTS